MITTCVLLISINYEIGANTDPTVADSATLEVTDPKCNVAVVTLSAEDNVKLVKQLNKEFKWPCILELCTVTDL